MKTDAKVRFFLESDADFRQNFQCDNENDNENRQLKLRFYKNKVQFVFILTKAMEQALSTAIARSGQ